MRCTVLFALSLALVLVAPPLPIEAEETCRSGFTMVNGRWVCLDDEEAEGTNGLQSAFLALLDTLENAAKQVLTSR